MQEEQELTPPLKCAACSTRHKANNPLCPICIKHMTELRNKAMIPQDETMEPEQL
jgi:predicted amidophosphoribosyltransferase